MKGEVEPFRLLADYIPRKDERLVIYVQGAWWESYNQTVPFTYYTKGEFE